jgi:hypothetical protein
MSLLLAIWEGMRIYARARRVKREGFRRYAGSPERMCRAIIRDAYDEKNGYFRVSSGHFCEFYVRDFAWCAPALVRLGYKSEVASTLRYALGRFEAQGQVTTMLTPSGRAFDFPCYGPDTLALLLKTIGDTKSEALAREHRALLQREVDRFVRLALDEQLLLPRCGAFTSMRDQAERERSCYDACMIALVAMQAPRLGLRFPVTFDAIKEKIMETYWNGTYFFSDAKRQPLVTGDANIVPFWMGITRDKGMLRSALRAIIAAGLDEPFPLRYVSTLDKRRERVRYHVAARLTPDYETDSIWMHMGPAYVRLLAQVDKARARRHVRAYTRNLKRHGTFLEVYDAKGKPYSVAFYVTDEAMLWCAPYLELSRELGAAK